MKKILFICIICLLECSKKETVIYENTPFEDIYSLAEISNSPFCIVLTDSSNHLSKEFIFQLEKNYKTLLNKTIFNIVDINSYDNEWYIKWLTPVSVPLTCVFSQNGELIDLFPGASKETFLYTAEPSEKKVAFIDSPLTENKKKDMFIEKLGNFYVLEKLLKDEGLI